MMDQIDFEICVIVFSCSISTFRACGNARNSGEIICLQKLKANILLANSDSVSVGYEGKLKGLI